MPETNQGFIVGPPPRTPLLLGPSEKFLLESGDKPEKGGGGVGYDILIHVFIVLKPDVICTFLIHSTKNMTALFNLV